MIRRPPRSTQSRSSAASDVYKRQVQDPGPMPGPNHECRGTGIRKDLTAPIHEKDLLAGGVQDHAERCSQRLDHGRQLSLGVPELRRRPHCPSPVSVSVQRDDLEAKLSCNGREELDGSAIRVVDDKPDAGGPDGGYIQSTQQVVTVRLHYTRRNIDGAHLFDVGASKFLAEEQALDGSFLRRGKIEP